MRRTSVELVIVLFHRLPIVRAALSCSPHVPAELVLHALLLPLLLARHAGRSVAGVRLVNLPRARGGAHAGRHDGLAAAEQARVLLLCLAVPPTHVLVPIRLGRVLCDDLAQVWWEVLERADHVFRDKRQMAHVPQAYALRS